jgi:hypothetical protein
MINKQSFVLSALAVGAAVGTLVSVNASALALEGKFGGAYVCEKTPFTRDILRTPLDLVIHANNVQFARPLFNLKGTRVLGSELGTGTIDADGKLHLSSTWTYLGNTAVGDYSGTLTASGGTLIGTQTWTGPQGTSPVIRACTAALVPAPPFAAAARDDARE